MPDKKTCSCYHRSPTVSVAVRDNRRRQEALPHGCQAGGVVGGAVVADAELVDADAAVAVWNGVSAEARQAEATAVQIGHRPTGEVGETRHERNLLQSIGGQWAETVLSRLTVAAQQTEHEEGAETLSEEVIDEEIGRAVDGNEHVGDGRVVLEGAVAAGLLGHPKGLDTLQDAIRGVADEEDDDDDDHDQSDVLVPRGRRRRHGVAALSHVLQFDGETRVEVREEHERQQENQETVDSIRVDDPKQRTFTDGGHFVAGVSLNFPVAISRFLYNFKLEKAWEVEEHWKSHNGDDLIPCFPYGAQGGGVKRSTNGDEAVYRQQNGHPNR